LTQEDDVLIQILYHLQSEGWKVFQYHAPGGQAGFALHLINETVYPDMVCYNDGVVLVIEVKPKQNVSDIEKLLKMKDDPGAIEQIKSFVRIQCGLHRFDIPDKLSIKFAHGFASSEALQPHESLLYIVVSDSNVEIMEHSS